MKRLVTRVVCAAAMLGATLLARAEAPARITLDHCLAEALEANPDLRSASARLAAARAAQDEVASALYPQVGVAGNWARTDNPPQAFFMSLNQRRASLQKDFNNPDDTENMRGSLVAQWRLYDSGRQAADREAVAAAALAAHHSLRAAHNELVFEVTRAYYTLLQAREFVGVRTDALANLAEHIRVARARLEAGSAMKTDVLNLEVQQSQAREELIRAENGVRLAREALNTTIGRALVGEADVAGLADTLAGADHPAGREAGAARPEWLAAQAQVAAAEAMTRRARRDYLPVVSTFGSLDMDMDPFHGPERSYMVGAAVELNLFDGFRSRAGVARAAANLVEAQAQTDKLHLMLELDLTRARLSRNEAAERYEVATRSLATAEEALRITRERFGQGAAPVTDLISAQLGLTATRARVVAARYENLIAAVDVRRADGLLAGGEGNSRER